MGDASVKIRNGPTVKLSGSSVVAISDELEVSDSLLLIFSDIPISDDFGVSVSLVSESLFSESGVLVSYYLKSKLISKKLMIDSIKNSFLCAIKFM